MGLVGETWQKDKVRWEKHNIEGIGLGREFGEKKGRCVGIIVKINWEIEEVPLIEAQRRAGRGKGDILTVDLKTKQKKANIKLQWPTGELKM